MQSSSRLSRSGLTKLQWLCHNGLFVVPPAAAETKRRRQDDRASYKDTHGIPRPWCLSGNIITLPRQECCGTWDTLWDEKELLEEDVRAL